MKILALNSGSSSIKYRVFDVENRLRLREQGVAERIGQPSSSVTRIMEDKPPKKEAISLTNHREAMRALFPRENDPLYAIEAVGHRIVHGGERFKGPVLIDNEVVDAISELAEFAPLHCEPNIVGIEELRKRLPDIPHIAVFDTSAHAEMDRKAFLYGIPTEYYEKYKIRKYGFHGINHSYIAQEAAALLKKPLDELKIVTCHLGNGCSVTAFEKGKSIDNSMGFTPLEGLVMGTRCGDLDPSVVLYLIEKLEPGVEGVKDLLNKQSGLSGLCGKSDMRDIMAMAKAGDMASQTAIAVFVYRIQKYIGAYVAALNGVDLIIFSGGIGENSSVIRSLVMKNFSYLGARLDDERNERNDPVFSSDDSKLFLMTIPADEEKAIAEQTYRLLSCK